MKKLMTVFFAATVMMFAGLAMAEGPLPSDLTRAIIKVDSLSCGGCFSTINAELVKLDGYSGLGTNIFRKIIAVDYSAPLSPDDILAKLANIGYPGELESVAPINEEESFAYLESKRSRAGGTGSCGSGTGGSCCKPNETINLTNSL